MGACQMTRIELIQEDIARYGANPRATRATIGSTCVYHVKEDGRMCAIGHRARPELLAVLSHHSESLRSYCLRASKSPDDVLRPEYHGSPSDLPEEERVAFWQLLQLMHDTSDCWHEDESVAKKTRGTLFALQDTRFLQRAEAAGILTIPTPK